ncbi:MAG: ParB N-terminal domain-containing protein [Nitrospirae bacterium]|nr:ParB N-terminal domain-containing protein [Nitrospirota bacterium]
MFVRNISIDGILVEGSRFSPGGFLYESDNDVPGLEASFRNLGIIHPVIVYDGNTGPLHLIDGRKRIQYALGNHFKEISAVILPESTPLTDIVTLILVNRKTGIEQSIMTKVRFICFAMDAGLPEPWILDHLCAAFGFRPYSDFLKDCRRIDALSVELKLFCHEKKFSLKQILNLTHYPEEILSQLMAWRADIQLTASIMDEIASNLKDHLRAQNETLGDFMNEEGLAEIFQSALSPRDKTERLRELVRSKRFPILSGVQAKMDKTVEGLKLPGEISLDWDRTLENRNVDITVHLKDIKSFDVLLEKVSSPEMKKAVENLLDEL